MIEHRDHATLPPSVPLRAAAPARAKLQPVVNSLRGLEEEILLLRQELGSITTEIPPLIRRESGRKAAKRNGPARNTDPERVKYLEGKLREAEAAAAKAVEEARRDGFAAGAASARAEWEARLREVEVESTKELIEQTQRAFERGRAAGQEKATRLQETWSEELYAAGRNGFIEGLQRAIDEIESSGNAACAAQWCGKKNIGEAQDAPCPGCPRNLYVQQLETLRALIEATVSRPELLPPVLQRAPSDQGNISHAR